MKQQNKNKCVTWLKCSSEKGQSYLSNSHFPHLVVFHDMIDLTDFKKINPEIFKTASVKLW